MTNNRIGRSRKSYIGQKLGKIIVLCDMPDRLVGKFATRYIFGLCECGKTKTIPLYSLTSGKTISCGCYNATQSSKRASDRIAEGFRPRLSHGHAASTGSRTYNTWVNMRRRCNNPSATQWKYYGALGVSVCARWSVFENFLADMGERPKGKTIDRYPDPTGNYEPSNCRWATVKQQRNNRRK